MFMSLLGGLMIGAAALLLYGTLGRIAGISGIAFGTVWAAGSEHLGHTVQDPRFVSEIRRVLQCCGRVRGSMRMRVVIRRLALRPLLLSMAVIGRP